MKNRLITCVLACLMIFLVGCNGNTAKEAAQEITKTETSFPAGNTETHSQEETEKSAVREKATITADENQSTAESQTVATVQTKPAEEKSADNPVTEKPKTETPQQTSTQAVPEKQPEQPKEQTTTEKKSEEKPAEKPAEPPKQVFDVSPYVSYAKEYAVSIGLSLDSTATECWDNPISANPNRSGIKSDIESRLNRYKNSEGFTAVWIWAEKASDTEYNIYIGYC